MLEKLLMEALNLETRKDTYLGSIRKIDLNLKCDLAHVRCQFKRFLNENKNISVIRAYYDFNNAYAISKESFVNGWDKLEDKEKIIKSLKNIILKAQEEGHPIFAIKFC